MAMDWDKLRIFYDVARAGSLSGACKSLNLSQSVISRHISTLEESLGTPLFRRHARGLALTEQGEILFESAEQITQSLMRVEDDIHASQDLPHGPLIITVSSFIGSTWLAPKLARFCVQHPEVELTVLFDNKYFDLNKKEADAAIRLEMPAGHDLMQHHLTTLDFCVCASKDYIKRYGRPETFADLKDHYLIGYPENTEPPFENARWFLEKAGVGTDSGHKLLRMNSMYAIQKAVTTGAGIATLPHYVIAESDQLEILSLEEEHPSVDIFFVYAQEQQNSKRMELFRDFLLRKIKATDFAV